MNVKEEWKKLDWTMIAAFLLLCAIGCLEIYFSTKTGEGSPYLARQILRIALGMVIFVVILFLDYRSLFSNIIVIYILSVGLLLFVRFFGVEVRSAKSWFSIGGVLFQPTELVKIVIVLTLAKILADVAEKYLNLLNLLLASLIVLIPMAIIVWQHDVGSALPLVPLLVAMLILAGVRKGVVIISVLVLALGLAGSWFVLQKYQKERILIVLNPQSDPKKMGYQTLQSIIAIGSGGFSGRGFGQGSQGAMGFLPEKHTDFIFSIVGEELGLLGGIAVFGLYFIFLYRSLRIAYNAQDKRIIYTGAGIATLYGIHFVMNVGMALGLMPVIGLPLPPVSYGGSSVVSAFVAIGLMNNFKIHQSFM